MLIEMITKETSHLTGFKVNKEIVRNSVLFVVSSIMGLNRLHYISRGQKKYANFFGVTFAGSGSGKDASLMIAENAFREIIDRYAPFSKEVFESLHGTLPNGDELDKVSYIAPTQYKVPLQGTPEGMMRVANFYNDINVGSLNVIATEFGHEIGSATTLPVLTKLWQEAKADGSTTVNEKYQPVEDVPTNILLFGSAAPFDRNEKKHDLLVETIESGLARRTFFTWAENEEAILHDELSNMNTIKEYALQIVEFIRHKLEPLTFNKNAIEALNLYRKELTDTYNKKRSEWNSIKRSNVDKVERLAAIYSVIDMSPEITDTHVTKAIATALQSSEAMEKVIRPQMPYLKMYRLLNLEQSGLSVTEMLELGVKLKTKRETDDNIELLKEYAYRKNKLIKEIGSKANKRYVLSDLEVNKLDKMILSTSSRISNKPEMEINFKSQEVPFFGKGMSVEGLLTSDIQSYCLNHFESTDKAPDGHRKKEYVISGQNMIAWDIDEGMSMDEMKNILEPYQYLMYTTKSHQKNKNGIVCDRFRVIIPTETTFYVNPEEHKGLYENIARVLNIPSYDVATRNQGRLWFVNKTGQVWKKDTGNLLDVRCCIPETEVSDHIIPNMENLDLDESDKRIAGMQKFVLINGIGGNRNNVIFRLAKFVQELGGSTERIVYETNAMLLEPLHENEIRTILQNI